MTALLVLDFDGVLVVPYTDPEAFFPGALETIAALRQDERVGAIVVVSSNPRAFEIAGPHVDAIRARSATRWWEVEADGVYRDDALYATTNHKGHMLQSILAGELRGRAFDRVLVVDDKASKAAEIFEAFPNASGKPGEPAPTHPFSRGGVHALITAPLVGMPSAAAILAALCL